MWLFHYADNLSAGTELLDNNALTVILNSQVLYNLKSTDLKQQLLLFWDRKRHSQKSQKGISNDRIIIRQGSGGATL